jgi:CO/xanthine dehydrogenase FAD-binding subunit
MPLYARPTVLDEALQVLARGATVLAGGTDHYAARVGKPLSEPILDITAIRGLRRIEESREDWRIGAAVTWTDVLEAELPSVFDGLKLAAREIGGVQIQNSGTLAGNLCNASPAADGVPALLALDASVELANSQTVRAMPLAEFITGPRMTQRRNDELLTAILVPKPQFEARSHFLKLGARKYLVISIAMASVVVEHEAGVVRKARVAVGSCSPVALRLQSLEDALRGQPLDVRLAEIATAAHMAPLTPIDDVRASGGYRLDSALTVVRRTLAGVCA